VLIDHGKQAWKDTVRFFGAESEDSAPAGRQAIPRRTQESHGPDEMAVGAACLAIVLVVVGAPVVGFAVGGATALCWLLWRLWPRVSTTATACGPPVRGEARGPEETPGARRPRGCRNWSTATRRPGLVARVWHRAGEE
jgi:hypothetical protein